MSPKPPAFLLNDRRRRFSSSHADEGREPVPEVRPAVGQGLSAAAPRLDPGRELQERLGQAPAGGHLSVPVRGGDPQREAAQAQLCQPTQELRAQLLLKGETNFHGGGGF